MFQFIKPRAASMWATSMRVRPAPNTFTTRPLSMRSIAQRHVSIVSNPQVVRFRKAPIKARNVAITCIVTVVCFQVYTQLVLGPLDKAAEEASQHISEEEFQEAEQPLFIPFPGTAKQLPLVPYKGTDPEWKEFIKISKDQKLMEKVKADLAAFIRDQATQTPFIAQLIGKTIKTRRVWLDVDFPAFPPPSFERSGIEISDDAISWVTQPVDARIVYKIRNVLWPTALFQSSWSFMKVLAAEEFRNIAGVFGLEIQASPAQQSIDQVLARSQKLMKEMNGQQKVPGNVQQPLTAKDGLPQQPLGDKGKEIGDTSAPGKLKDDLLSAISSSTKGIHESFARPIMAAKITYAEMSKKLRKTKDIHPRGSIKVSGFVELESDRAFLVFDVVAAWNPKTKEYDRNSMSLVLRRIQKKRQAPMA